MGAIAQGVRSLTDRLSTRIASLLLFLFYVLLCALHVIAVVTLFNSADGPYTFAFVAVILGTIGHFLVPVIGVALFHGYVIHPVWPRLAFVFADITAAVTLGLTIGFGTSGAQTWPAVGNIVLAVVAVMQCLKYVVLGLDIRSWFEDADDDPL